MVENDKNINAIMNSVLFKNTTDVAYKRYK